MASVLQRPCRGRHHLDQRQLSAWDLRPYSPPGSQQHHYQYG